VSLEKEESQSSSGHAFVESVTRRLGPVAEFVVIFLIVGQLIAYSVHGGWLWQVLASGLSDRHDFNLVRDTSRLIGDETYDCIIVGDRRFVETVVAELDPALRYDVVELPRASSWDVASTLERLVELDRHAHGRLGRFIVQNCPTLWSNEAHSNLRFRSEAQNVSLFQRSSNPLLPTVEAENLFTAIETWAKKPDEAMGQISYRMTNLEHLTFVPIHDTKLGRYVVDQHLAGRIVWVDDYREFNAEEKNRAFLAQHQRQSDTLAATNQFGDVAALDQNGFRNLNQLASSPLNQRARSIRISRKGDRHVQPK